MSVEKLNDEENGPSLLKEKDASPQYAEFGAELPVEPYVREACPICGHTEATFLCRMGKEYLQSGDRGWGHSPELLKLSAIDFDEDPQAGCTYVECDQCSTFYIQEVYPVEMGFTGGHENEKTQRETYDSLSAKSTPGLSRTAFDISNLLMLAAKSTSRSQVNFLDYGYGMGDGLQLARSLGMGRVTGFSPVVYLNDLIRTNLSPGIELVSDPDVLQDSSPFDAIMCNSVLEHVDEPNAVVDHIRSLLAPGGVASFSAPTVRRKEMRRHAQFVQQNIKVKTLHQGHLQIWNKDRLSTSNYVAGRGFKIIPKSTVVHSGDLTTTRDFGLFLARHIHRPLRTTMALLALRFATYRVGSFYAQKI